MSELDDDIDAGYYEVGFGLRDYLPKLPRPVIAWPGTGLWRALLHAHGFVIAGAQPGHEIRGFFTTYFVRARDQREAAAEAIRIARKRWEASISASLATGALVLDVEEVEPAGGRFRWRSSLGYTFYSDVEE